MSGVRCKAKRRCLASRGAQVTEVVVEYKVAYNCAGASEDNWFPRFLADSHCNDLKPGQPMLAVEELHTRILQIYRHIFA